MNNRRNFLKKTTLAGAALAATPSFGFNILKNVLPEDEIIGHGDFKYKVVKDWAKMSGVFNPILNCHEMQMDSKGRLIMLGDHTANNILVFDKSGKLLDYWGTRYPGGHGLTLHDEGGEDMLYIVDCGWFPDIARAINNLDLDTRCTTAVTKSAFAGNRFVAIVETVTNRCV